MRPILLCQVLLLLLTEGCQNVERMRAVAAEEAMKVYSEMTGVETINLTKPLGPYSTAKRVGGFLFVAGQIGINPASGELDTRGIEAETRQVMENVQRVLELTGFSFSDVIHATVYLKDMKDYAEMNAVYGSYFAEGTYPSRATVEVSNLPARARLEISVVAYKQRN